MFDELKPDFDGGTLAKSIKMEATAAYGAAGPEFVRRLIADAVNGEGVNGLIEKLSRRRFRPIPMAKLNALRSGSAWYSQRVNWRRPLGLCLGQRAQHAKRRLGP